MITYPNCKINLGLRVMNRRPDGYHNLQSIFLPVMSLTDELEIVPDSSLTPSACYFTQRGIPIDGDVADNLCVRAYRLLHEAYPQQVGAVRMCLNKRIPFGAGLGGGSADAAFTLLMLNDIFSLNLSQQQLMHFSLQLGADCLFFVHNQPAYVTGIGDEIQPIEFSLSQRHLRVEIIKPEVSISTREAYSGITPRDCRDDFSDMLPLTEALNRPASEWRDFFVNDFEQSVFTNHPEIAKLKQHFYDQGAIYSSMSGSGSAVYGIFASEVLQ